MIVSLIFDLGISNLPVVLAKTEQPIVLDAIPSRALVVLEQIVEQGRMLEWCRFSQTRFSRARYTSSALPSVPI
jgi:hypothetical protein